MSQSSLPAPLFLLKNKDTTQSKVFRVLEDKKWHCRGCAYRGIESGQLAGGGGIQGLERGTASRPGLVIESESRECPSCNKRLRHDRWTGRIKEANSTAHIPRKLAMRILAHFKNTDVIEQRQRQDHELIIDHRFPMERWGAVEEKNNPKMSDDAIERKFQLLKKDDSGNHNLLKSRACESCIRTGRRGKPLGIKFYYQGNESWPDGVPKKGAEAEKGCVGCGWYAFDKWRTALNEELLSPHRA